LALVLTLLAWLGSHVVILIRAVSSLKEGLRVSSGNPQGLIASIDLGGGRREGEGEGRREEGKERKRRKGNLPVAGWLWRPGKGRLGHFYPALLCG
jgi:hypothetical protein